MTILVAAEGEFKLPTINGNADLKAALRKLGSIPADSIQVRAQKISSCYSLFREPALFYSR